PRHGSDASRRCGLSGGARLRGAARATIAHGPIHVPAARSAAVSAARAAQRRAAVRTEEFSLASLRTAYSLPVSVTLSRAQMARVRRSAATVDRMIARGGAVYGVNTGFGLLAQTRIPTAQLAELQRNLVLSHSAGVGACLSDAVVRLVLVLKIGSLAQGFSGVRPRTLLALARLLETDTYPCIPSKGSVGASGDLAPLAHLAAALLGVGQVRAGGRVMTAAEGLRRIGLQPLELAPKEGLALLNGTQVSTALALAGLFAIQDVFGAALLTGALSVDALKGSDVPFDDRIHVLRRQPGQRRVATALARLLGGSRIRASHLTCERVQDPYSLRCQPQVMGACLDVIESAGQTLLREANAVTDNPLVFAADGEVLSGGNFHAEPVALAADQLALAAAEIGSLSERRTALLIDPKMSGLPAFLVAENKTLAAPASVDSIPTSAGQEDHVSMATHGARRLLEMAANATGVVAIELLAAAQGIEFHRPLTSSRLLEAVLRTLRRTVPR